MRRKYMAIEDEHGQDALNEAWLMVRLGFVCGGQDGAGSPGPVASGRSVAAKCRSTDGVMRPYRA